MQLEAISFSPLKKNYHMNEIHLDYPNIQIPAWMMEVPYNGRIIPNGKKHDLLASGANCQVFAYELLRYNGRVVPELRSSELWADTEYSSVVTAPFQALDIAFIHKILEAWGAHIGVFVNEHEILHNAKSEGFPVIWPLEKFKEYDKYQVFIGAKRFRKA